MTHPPLTAPVLGAVAAGGALGALARWWIGTVVPDAAGFPWTTFGINVVGTLLLALLPLVAIRRIVIAALGPGLLGGFTTLSAYSEQARALLADGQTWLAAAYVAGTLAACLAAVQLASLATTGPERVRFEEQEGNE